LSVRIQTERLLLRRPRAEDAADLAAAYADPETVRYIGDGSTATLPQVEQAIDRWLERWDINRIGLFAIEHREDGRVLGRAGFLVWDSATWEVANLAEASDRAEVELGWMLSREHWGHGYATESALALRDWGLAERSLTRLISLIRPGNDRSIRVAEKIGERYEREIVMGGLPARLYALEVSR
jgi:RimJ/RimL family protein N-acetyltransferase